jgi:hypothetical protein
MICLGPGFQASPGSGGSFHAFVGTLLESITIGSDPPGLTINVDGNNYAAPHVFQWAAGSSHAVNLAAAQSGGTGTQYQFSNWSDGGAGSHTITVPLPQNPTDVTPSSPPAWIAYFATQYYLTTGAGAGGSISPPSGWYNSGTLVPVTATPNTGYQFTGFSGSLTGTPASQGVFMIGSQSVSASFAAAPAPVVTTTSLPAASTLTSYLQPLYASGGYGSYTWALASGSSLPSWLSLSSGGTLAGTPPAGAGDTTVSFTVQAADEDGALSSPQPLSLTVYYQTLSINGGPSTAQVAPGVTVPFAFSYYDQNGANDIGWAQFLLEDRAGNLYCYGDWGRPNALDLYDGNTGVTYGFGVNQSDAFCTVSLGSITNPPTDPTLVTVVLNLTFAAGYTGSYSVLTQVNYLSGYAGPWNGVGTVNVETAPTVQLSDLTQGTASQPGQALAAWAGDDFTVTVAGPPGQAVTVNQNGAGDSYVGTTDSNGNWSTTSAWQATDVGSYSQVWKVGGATALPNPLMFQVTALLSSVTTSGTPPPDTLPTPPPDTSPPQFVKGSAQQCTDVTGTWVDNAEGSTWSLVQTGSAITGTDTQAVPGGQFTWQASGTNTNGSVTVNAGSPSGSAPGATPASTITLVFTPACNLTTGTETLFFPQGVEGGPETYVDQTVLSRRVVPSISFSFDPNGARVTGTLTGTGKSATLLFFLNNAGTESPLLTMPNATAGNFSYPIDWRQIVPGYYYQVMASWDTIAASSNIDLKVIGGTGFSQYNTPTESACSSGVRVPAYILDLTQRPQSCTWTSVTFDSQFRQQVNINGSGMTLGGLKVQSSFQKPITCGLPAGGVQSKNSRSSNVFASVSAINPECGNGLTSGITVATAPGPKSGSPDFSCKDKILVFDLNSGSSTAIRSVQDECPACNGGWNGQPNHIDVYSSLLGCTAKSIGGNLPSGFAIRVR